MEGNISLHFIEISRYSTILAALFALFRFRTSEHAQRYLCILVFISIFVEYSALFIIKILEQPNLPLLHVFTVFEFALIALIFKPRLEPYISQKGIFLLIGFFTLFAIFNSLFNENIFQINAFARAVEAILIIAMALLYFYVTLKNLSDKQLEKSPTFWISSGVLLYFSTSFFIFIYSNYLINSKDASYTIWGLHALMSIVLNIFYIIALWVKPET